MDRRKAIELLDLTDDFTADELKRNYKICVRKYHPDNEDVEDDSKFIEIKEAYEFLASAKSSKAGDTQKPGTTSSRKPCDMCNGSGFRREKVKTPNGYKAIRVSCKYCNGAGIK